MGRRRIETKDFVRDVRSGISHSDLMKKYGLSQKVLDDVFGRLVKSGQLSPSDLMRDVSQSFESTLVVATTCPRCGSLLWADSGECGNCLANRISEIIGDDETSSTASLPQTGTLPEKPPTSGIYAATEVKAIESLLPENEEFVFDEIDEQEPEAVEQEPEVVEPESEVTVSLSGEQEVSVDLEEPERKSRRWLPFGAMIFSGAAVLLAVLFYFDVLELPEMFRSGPPALTATAKPQPPVAAEDTARVATVPQRSASAPEPLKKGEPASLESQIASAGNPSEPRERQAGPHVGSSSPSSDQTGIAPGKTIPTEAVPGPASPPTQSLPENEPRTSPVPPTTDRAASLTPAPEPSDLQHGSDSAESSGNSKSQLGGQADLNSALAEAVREGRVERAMVLLDRGANVNALDSKGSPLLVAAARRGNESLVDLLLNRGADVSLKDKDDFTALGRACEAGNARIIELLLSHDKSKGAADLLEACENGKTQLAQLMLEGGADMNARTSEGGTPLMIAAAKGNLELVEALLAKGADATAQDNKGFTALAWAYSPTAMNVTPFKVQREIIRLLKHHEAPKPGVAAGRE